MSDKDGPKKRRRPTLYKKDTDGTKDEDVLKKLKEVRQSLQDSLTDDKKPGIPEPAPIKKTPLPTTGPKKAPGRRERVQYFKKEDLMAPEKTRPTRKAKVVKKKQVKKVSQKRMARVNARVKARMEKLKGLSRKKKALVIVWFIIMTVPLFFLSTLSVIGLEFHFSEFGLVYNENKPGTVMLSFGVRNPSFMPAQLGVFELELYSEDGKYIGKAYNNDFLTVAPYETKELFVTLAFNEKEGGKWWSDWLSDLVLSLNIGKITYNGLAMDASALPPIELDTGPMIRDMITGLLDLEELVEGLDLGDMLGLPEEEATDPNAAITLDPYSNAKKRTIINRLAPKVSQIEGMEDMTANLSFAMSENEEEFSLGLSALINLKDLVSTEDLAGIVLGPIKLDNLDVQLVVNTEHEYEDVYELKDDDNWWKHYNTPIAKLWSTKENEIYIADAKERDSIFGMNLTIVKDDPEFLQPNNPGNPNGPKHHPSADIDWEAASNDPNSIENFLAGEGAFEYIGGPA
jgi:hypothetical protein